MANEIDALSDAKFDSGLYLRDFPAKIRVLTRDPMVYVDKFANTKYVFAVYNLDEKLVQLLDKGPGFSGRFKEINQDPDFGGDVRKIDLKITTNGKPGIEVRYTITPVGAPSELKGEDVKVIVENGFDLAEKVKKNAPNALRLSAINAGKKLEPDTIEPSDTVDPDDVTIEDVGDEPIDLSKIPF